MPELSRPAVPLSCVADYVIAPAVGGMCPRQHQSRARGGRSKRRRTRQDRPGGVLASASHGGRAEAVIAKSCAARRRQPRRILGNRCDTPRMSNRCSPYSGSMRSRRGRRFGARFRAAVRASHPDLHANDPSAEQRVRTLNASVGVSQHARQMGLCTSCRRPPAGRRAALRARAAAGTPLSVGRLRVQRQRRGCVGMVSWTLEVDGEATASIKNGGVSVLQVAPRPASPSGLLRLAQQSSPTSRAKSVARARARMPTDREPLNPPLLA